MSNGQLKENVILVYVELPNANVEEDIYELNELIKTAGGSVVLTCTQKRNSLDNSTVIGSGKLDELKKSIDSLECSADVVIFSVTLGSTQRAILKKQLDCDVIDKIDLILDIFAMRATSAEGKKQVELAQISYNLATKPSGDFSRQGAGIGTRGPGETKLETDRRLARNRMYRLRQELAEIEKRRDVTRKKRDENGMFMIALVGYTNAGKSTLFNLLTESETYADDKLFATLDTTIRKITLNNGMESLICDTVGFIKDLPTTLLNAFKSTLEEAASADLILNVCDASNINVDNHIAVTESILSELGSTAPIIRVYNKCDKLDGLAKSFVQSNASAVYISAKERYNISQLTSMIEDAVKDKYCAIRLRIPYSDSAAVLSQLNRYTTRCNAEYTDYGVEISATLPKKYVTLFAKYLIF